MNAPRRRTGAVTALCSSSREHARGLRRYAAALVGCALAACSGGSAPQPPPAVREDAVVDASIVHEFTIAEPDPSTRAASNAAMAFGGGSHLVAWEERTCTGAACGAPRVRAAVVGPTGVVGTAIDLGANVDQQGPAVAFDGANFLVVWTEGAQLLGRRVSAAGAAVETTPTVLHGGTVALGRPAVAASAATPEYLVAVQEGPDLRGVRVTVDNRGRIGRSNGVLTIATAAGFAGCAAGTCEPRGPAVASDGAAYLVAWTVHGAAAAVHAARVTNTSKGLALGATQRLDVGAAAGEPAAGARIAWNGQRYLVAWSASSSTTRAIRLDAAAALAEGEPLLASPAGLGGDCGVAASAGTFVVVYRRTSGASSALYGARVGSTGGALDADGFWIEADRPLDAVSADASANFAVVSTVALGGTSRTGLAGRIGPAAAWPVTISSSGGGSGTVSSPPVFEHAFCPTCPSFHDHLVAEGTRLVVTAVSATDRFVGFSGDCTGTTCDVVAVGDPIMVDARFEPAAPPSHPLTVVVGGDASGAVASGDGLISCGVTCDATYVEGATVTLTASPEGDATVSWSFEGSGCTASGLVATCAVGAPVTVRADFHPPAPTRGTLAVSKVGSGAVTSTPAAIDCGPTCSAELDGGTALTLTAVPDLFSTFTGWGGACSGVDPVCAVTITAGGQADVLATFGELTGTVTVTVAGQGTVTSDPAGIICEPACTAEFTAWRGPVTLTAIPQAGWRFAGWSGDCTGTTATCALSPDGDHAADARFEEIPPTLHRVEIATAGSGTGTVTATPAGASCGPGCADHVEGTRVTLHAEPSAGSSFAGWGSTCPGTGDCTVTVSSPLAIVAAFDLLPPPTAPLTVTKTGTGVGTVTSAPGGVSCGTTCTSSFEVGTPITLTAAPIGDSRFVGWGGACSGTGPCTLEVDAATTVSARFDAPATYPLTATANGTGAGRISGGPIDCAWSPAQGYSGTCSADPDRGAVVVLTATATDGSTFAGWSGGPCSGTSATCSVTMDRATLVAATFQAAAPEASGPIVHVRIFGSAYGRVVGGPIDCVPTGTACAATFSAGSVVTLTAYESALARFVGWSSCTPVAGAPLSCTVAPTVNTVVIATFETIQPPPPTSWPVTIKVFGRGRVSGGSGVDCVSGGAGTCSASVPVGASLSLDAAPAAGYTFREWRGCTPRVDAPASCTVSPRASTAVVAVFDPPPPPPPPSTYPVHVRLFGGAGSVAGSGFDCRRFAGTCVVQAAPGTPLLLTAHEGANPFERWQGCSPTADPASCRLDVSRATVVGAFFEWPPLPPPPATYSIHLRTFGLIGNVTADGAACSSNLGACRVEVANGGTVTFRATPPPGAVLGQWAGCRPDPLDARSCTATADRSKVVTVTFVAAP